MASITSWMRLEPRSRNAEMKTSLQAAVYDPLWLLARQWQMGEFQGEDNGSPVIARWRADTAPLTRYRAGTPAPGNPGSPVAYDARRVPLETLVERETVRPAATQPGKPDKLRLAAEAGEHFLRLVEVQPVSKNYDDAIVGHFAFLPLSDADRKASGCEQPCLPRPCRPARAGRPPSLRCLPSRAGSCAKAAPRSGDSSGRHCGSRKGGSGLAHVVRVALQRTCRGRLALVTRTAGVRVLGATRGSAMASRC